MGPHALLDQRDEKTIQLVRGDFYVETATPVVFKTPYARVWCDDDCKAIFSRKEDQIEIKNILGNWVVERNGEKTNYALHAGLRVEVSEVAGDGKALMEFPQSLPWGPTVKQLAELFPGHIKELKPTLVKFREVWKAAVEEASELQQKAAARSIASFEDEQAKERARKALREREDQRLRALFREKNP
jgi:hypothetical protein